MDLIVKNSFSVSIVGLLNSHKYWDNLDSSHCAFGAFREFFSVSLETDINHAKIVYENETSSVSLQPNNTWSKYVQPKPEWFCYLCSEQRHVQLVFAVLPPGTLYSSTTCILQSAIGSTKVNPLFKHFTISFPSELALQLPQVGKNGLGLHPDTS